MSTKKYLIQTVFNFETAFIAIENISLTEFLNECKYELLCFFIDIPTVFHLFALNFYIHTIE